MTTKSEARMTAKDIKRFLATKHKQDVFVTECKAGPTAYHGAPQLDAWVMKKSWAHPLLIGYEIKVSRSDFLNDRKWINYLEFCNEFYFVCPWGLISPKEVPDKSGLLYATKTGSKFITKVKAPYRIIESPELLYRYILMARVQVIDETTHINQRGYWQDWLREKDEDKHLGWNVSRKIRELVAGRIDSVERENNKLKRENDALQQAKIILESFGIDEPDAYDIEERITKAITLIPQHLITSVLRCGEALKEWQEEIKAKGE